ncbi:unnamed protein product [marine sediment metagenome]|uniref:Uncharacterized protein n=1 Tax=marine sediment metagenome TaxID=412755 RepID=X1ELQ3_9ZZZZ
MQIAQILVGNVIYPLTEGQPLPIMVGDTLRVFFTFNYRLPKTTDVRIWASLYKYSLGIIDRQGQAQTKEVITLEKTLSEWKPYEGEIDIVIGDMPLAIYGLILELPDYDEEERIDESLEVTGVPSIWESLGSLLILFLMISLVKKLTPKPKKELVE